MARLGFLNAVASFALAILLSVAASAAPSDDFARLLRDYDEAQLKLFPSNAIQRNDKRYLGLYENNLTSAHLAEERRLNARERSRLAAIDSAALTGQDRLSYDILAWILAMRAQEIAPGAGEARQMLCLDQFNGAHLAFARELEWRSHYPYMTAAGYRAAISRMQGFAHWIDAAIARMRDGMTKGIVLPRVIVRRIVAEIDQLVGPPEASLFLGPTRNIPASIKGAERARIAADFTRAIQDIVLPAYRRLGAFLKTEYLPKARAGVGLSALPGGRALYLQAVRGRTTLDLSPDAIHAVGLSALARIRVQMVAAKTAAGFSGTLDAFIAFLRDDPRFKFRNGPAMLAAFERARTIARAHIHTQLGRLPKTRLEFRPFEPFIAAAKSAAEYSPVSGDGRRPGIVYVNVFNLWSRPTYTTDALELHEGIPGHHVQSALAVENNALPPFRRFGGPSAFVEGWAMYAEQLGPALGLYTDPYQKFGELALDAWRSARLVVDTGIHWRGWSEQRAIAFLHAHTTLSTSESQTEVERYIAIPAQALAYKLGEMKFLELRDRAKAALGQRFDIRRFHDALIADGAMPLAILEARMERWIAAERIR